MESDWSLNAIQQPTARPASQVTARSATVGASWPRAAHSAEPPLVRRCARTCVSSQCQSHRDSYIHKRIPICTHIHKHIPICTHTHTHRTRPWSSGAQAPVWRRKVSALSYTRDVYIHQYIPISTHTHKYYPSLVK